MPIHRRVARLDSKNYIGRQTYFVTICCDRRKPYLSDVRTAHRTLDLLSACASKSSFVLHAYCLMPNHLHLLVEGSHDCANLLEFIRVFKSRTAFEFRKLSHRRLWEMSFHDHILRSSDSLEDVAIYIWSNPVRKKLCVRPQQFPFSGSHTIDWIRRARQKSVSSLPWDSKSPV